MQLATSSSKFAGESSKKAVLFANNALKFQVPFIFVSAIAPLICLVDDATTKQVFSTLHYVAVGTILCSYGIINHTAFGMVVKEMEAISNKPADLIKSLKNMKLLKREISSQAFQNTGLGFLFAVWPLLQVRASWNIAIAYPLVIHGLIVPIATKVFWPKGKGKGKKSSSVSQTSAGQTGANSTAVSNADSSVEIVEIGAHADTST